MTNYLTITNLVVRTHPDCSLADSRPKFIFPRPFGPHPEREQTQCPIKCTS